MAIFGPKNDNDRGNSRPLDEGQRIEIGQKDYSNEQREMPDSITLINTESDDDKPDK